MRSTPALSVIVRTVNRPQRLVEALGSLCEQQARNFEAVVVDMSRQGMAGAVDDARRCLPSVQHLRVGRPLPRSVALNLGISSARAPLISVLDDDNLYSPGHVARLIDGLADTRVDLVFTDVRRDTLTREGERIDSRTLESAFDYPLLTVRNFIYASSCAYRKEAWRRIGGYDLRFPVFEDWDLLIRLCEAGRVERLPGATAVVRNFTGEVGRPSHHDEADDLRRCRAGLFWTHRKLYTSEVLSRFPGVKRRARSKRYLSDLLGWWRTCHLGHRWRRRRWKTHCSRLPIQTRPD